MSQRTPSLLLVTSNGTGMGHLSRMLSVAKAVGDAGSCTVLSLSVALPVVIEAGLRGEYCPGPDRGPVAGPRWEHYLRDRVVALAEEVEAQVVAFDGVAPYRGLLLAKHRLPRVSFVWVRRGMWREGVNSSQLEKAVGFDAILEPGDLASAADRGATSSCAEAQRVPPVSMLEVVEGLDRAPAATALGLDPLLPTVLVTLGSGRLGDVEQPGRVVVSTLLAHTDWQIAVTTSAIAIQELPVESQSRVVQVRGVYPLARYLAAFDAAVSAAGYNAVHELLVAGVPTLLIPNLATRTDDQLTRASQLEAEGLALSARPDSVEDLRRSVLRLIDPLTRETLSTSIRGLPVDRRLGGARAIAERLVYLANNPPPPAHGVRARLLTAQLRAKEGMKMALGFRGTNLVRRVLRRPTIELFDPGRVAVRSDLMTDVTTEQLKSGSIEHVLRDSSDRYHAVRNEIASRYYTRSSTPGDG